ncbi:peptidoglycan DD-metalloendopeptidase family protein [Spirochaeta cellobiosiphila]|uniref:peptidoglycan DD-metalloendopeptidase family protein n=1 Tax=Spirochaeta cellobiosiphila TaxID=504483 RepID=UPI00040A39BE|nr:M23 family metallopeptidase [Spirochaeta cellobiosiphila]
MEILLQNQKVVRRQKNHQYYHNNNMISLFGALKRKATQVSNTKRMTKLPKSPFKFSRKTLLILLGGIPSMVLLFSLIGGEKEQGYWRGDFASNDLSLPTESGEELYYFDEIGTTYDGIGGAAADQAIIDLPSDAVLKAVDSFEYTVKNKDVLSSIAYDHNLALGTLISFNQIRNADKLKPGDVIKIPNMDGVLYKVKFGDNLNKIADEYGVAVTSILDANTLETDKLKMGEELFLPKASMNLFDLKRALNQLFLTPTRGVVTSPFGYRNDPFTGLRRFHNGLDIAGPLGTPIKAALDGTVVTVGYHSSYGNYIVINHQKGYQTLYGHLQKALVKKGQRVMQGDQIGLMGSTGYSTGSHLHFCVFENKKPVDPKKFLKL